MSGADVLNPDWLTRELIRPGGLWTQVEVVAETGSTNVDLASRARAGAEPGTIVVADHQVAGKGRLGRTWAAPAGTNVACSVLVRPYDVATQRWSWLPLLTGLAVTEALRRAADVPALLKWPNDVLIDGRKVCGILAERVETPAGPMCVIGFGINVHLSADDLPVPTATSLALTSPAVPTRNQVLVTVLTAFALLYDRWQSEDNDHAFAASYLQRSDTIGRQVRVILAGDQWVEGVAEAIDADGRLIVRTASGPQVFGAGDIVHLR